MSLLVGEPVHMDSESVQALALLLLVVVFEWVSVLALAAGRHNYR